MTRRALGGLLPAALAVLLLAAGCGSDAVPTLTTPPATTGAPSTTTGATSTTAAPTTTATAATTTSPMTTTATTSTTAPVPFDGDTSPKTASTQGDPSGLLTDVRYAQRAEGFTRIVWDFAGTTGLAAYEIAYEPGPFRDMGENPVPVAGTAFLVVRLWPASRVDLSVDPYVFTYTGPERIDPNTASVEEIVLLEDFEANMVWIVGLTAQKPFRAGRLADPPRIFVDVAD